MFRKEDGSTSYFLFACLMMVLYLSYRYPLQINSSVTSPTYIDTPATLKFGKYLLLIFMTILIAPFWNGRINVSNFIIFCAFTIPAMALGAVKYSMFYRFEFIFFPLTVVIFYSFSIFLGKIQISALSKLIKFLFFFGAMVDLVQVALFFTIGRLPALAYKDSFSVRFGSFLDDPNGYGVLCCAFIGWVYGYYKNRTFHHVLYQCVAIAMVLLTQSVTAVFCMGVVLCFIYYRYRFFWIAVLLLSLISIVFLDDIYSLFEAFLAMKQGSIDAHLTVKETPLTLLEILFGGDYNQQETWWLSLYVNYGAIFTFYWGGLMLLASFVFWKSRKPSGLYSLECEATFYSLRCFVLAFWAGMLNLPLPLVFPVNFIFFVVTFLAVQKKLYWP